MVASGTAMILLGLYGVYLAIRKKLEKAGKWFMRLMIVGISLPFIGNTSGWIMTEIGRQPWTVFGLLRTEDSISPGVTMNQITFTVIAFSTIYLILLGITIYLFIRTARKGPEGESNADITVQDPFAPNGGGRVVAE